MQHTIQDLLTRGVEEVHVREHLETALKSGRKLRVKHGIDPTGAKLHLGHAATLWKLREFQNLGHQIVIIIGDYTAQIGDPSDKLAKRPFLSETQVKENMATYQKQLGLILDVSKVEFHYNSEWLGALSLRKLDELAELFTVQQMISRRNFQERWDKEQEISLRELHYPLYEGYDSVMVKADVEVGGSDQLFNLLAGRKIQEAYNQPPQDIITTQMIVGLNGSKMSKTAGNTVNLLDTSEDMYGKIMSSRDELIPEYYLLCARAPRQEVTKVERMLKAWINPRDLKMKLARDIVSLYHGKEAAFKAEECFVRTFQKKEVPEEVASCRLPVAKCTLADLLIQTKIAPSKAEARRLIKQSGIKINGGVKNNPEEIILLQEEGTLLQKGKRQFLKIVPGE
jgi:tyrosyl-tRNA synthetase